MSVNIHYDECWKMITHLANHHKGDIASCRLDYTVTQLYHPRFDKKYDQLVPLLVIDWR